MAIKPLTDLETYVDYIPGMYSYNVKFEPSERITPSPIRPPMTIVPGNIPLSLINRLMQECFKAEAPVEDFLTAFVHSLFTRLEVTYDRDFNIRIKPE